MFCPNCGKQADDNAKYCQACGIAFLPAGTSPQPAVSTATGASYASVWVRLVALVIDAIIVAVASGLVTAGTFGVGVVVTFVGPWLYEAFMLSSEWQATVGKRAMNIVVTGMDGKRISFARATGRHFAKYLSAFILGIGFIMAFFTAKKQALHDLIADTLVINRQL
jgi:uncharacterized RDD family membrane protein YckC